MHACQYVQNLDTCTRVSKIICHIRSDCSTSEIDPVRIGPICSELGCYCRPLRTVNNHMLSFASKGHSQPVQGQCCAHVRRQDVYTCWKCLSCLGGRDTYLDQGQMGQGVSVNTTHCNPSSCPSLDSLDILICFCNPKAFAVLFPDM